MAAKRGPTTVYLDPAIARAAKVKAALSDSSLSDVVNDALARSLAEDARDLKVFKQRKGQPVFSYEEVLAGLKRDGLL